MSLSHHTCDGVQDRLKNNIQH
ncbi:hypothetical protein [Companilactobacillus versmoldensis]